MTDLESRVAALEAWRLKTDFAIAGVARWMSAQDTLTDAQIEAGERAYIDWLKDDGAPLLDLLTGIYKAMRDAE